LPPPPSIKGKQGGSADERRLKIRPSNINGLSHLRSSAFICGSLFLFFPQFFVLRKDRAKIGSTFAIHPRTGGTNGYPILRLLERATFCTGRGHHIKAGDKTAESLAK
jgi:hypothetical protein